MINALGIQSIGADPAGGLNLIPGAGCDSVAGAIIAMELSDVSITTIELSDDSPSQLSDLRIGGLITIELSYESSPSLCSALK